MATEEDFDCSDWSRKQCAQGVAEMTAEVAELNEYVEREQARLMKALEQLQARVRVLAEEQDSDATAIERAKPKRGGSRGAKQGVNRVTKRGGGKQGGNRGAKSGVGIRVTKRKAPGRKRKVVTPPITEDEEDYPGENAENEEEAEYE